MNTEQKTAGDLETLTEEEAQQLDALLSKASGGRSTIVMMDPNQNERELLIEAFKEIDPALQKRIGVFIESLPDSLANIEMSAIIYRLMRAYIDEMQVVPRWLSSAMALLMMDRDVAEHIRQKSAPTSVADLMERIGKMLKQADELDEQVPNGSTKH